MARPGWLLTLAWLAGFTLIDSSIVSLALADIARDFDRSVVDVAWVATGYLVALASTLIAAGRLRDRFGERRVMVAGGIWFLLATAASGLAGSFELLVAARLAQGAAGGVLYTLSLAIATTAFPPERRAHAISIYFTSGALGAVIGPVLGGFLTDLGGWRLVFLAQLPLPVLVAAMAWALLPRAASRPAAFDLPGVASASLFVLALTFALLQVPQPGSAPVVIAAGAVAVMALVAFVVRERRADTPAVRLAIFRNRRFVVGSVAGAGAWFAIMSSIVYSALYFQLGRGFDATTGGLLLLAAPAVGLVFFPFAGRLIGWLGLDRALLIGLVVQLASAVLMATWGRDTPMWFIVLTNLVGGAGVSMSLVASATDALSQFRPEQAGTGSALFNSLRQLGAALGVALPAVAFGLVAGGERTADAALAGSSAAFVLRIAVLAIPLGLLT
ncbi:MAG TPA: MFS transporter, partial [Candidatus Limnocylindria bacterium]|nr:MFS transporter [Candidatus Limnocylindria bacterium]